MKMNTNIDYNNTHEVKLHGILVELTPISSAKKIRILFPASSAQIQLKWMIFNKC